MAAQFSGRQPATVALDVGISVIRLLLPVLAALLFQELVSREFERKLYLSSLTYPRARYAFLLGRVAAITLMLLALLACLALLLAGEVALIAKEYQQATPVSLGWPYLLTMLFIALDLLVIVSVAALLSVAATTPSFVLLGTLGFTLIARSFSAIVALLQNGGGQVDHPQRYGASVNLLGYLLPDLHTLDVRMTALYGKMGFLPADWPLHVLSALAYILVMQALAMWTLNRKSFV
jgi:ABC-type transport system involved in multi-copper enzyme maturation permease subunit